MGKLNQPRTIPYSFKVFEMDGIVWLFDDSSRTYLCTSEPSIWAEPLYNMDNTDGSGDFEERSDYFSFDSIKSLKMVNLCTFDIDTSEDEAWDDAREMAHQNHLL